MSDDKTPAGWADPDDADYGDEVRATPAEAPIAWTPEREAGYQAYMAAIARLDAVNKETDARTAVMDEFPTLFEAASEIRRLRAELEAKS